MMPGGTQSQIDQLAEQAKLKIEAQNRQLANTSNTEAGLQQDIYADMREEMEEPEIPEIRRSMDYGEEDFHIEHAPSNDSEAELAEEQFDSIDTSEIFAGGPSISQVELWKKQFGSNKVFHTQILDKHFVFRTLDRYEYKQIVAIDNIDALYREEIICKTCTLYPFDYNFKKMAVEDGGYPSTLAQIIMENSGFTKDYGIEVL